MKKMLFLIVLIILSNGIQAQDKKEFRVESDGFEWFRVERDRLEGAEDKNGNMIIPCGFHLICYEVESRSLIGNIFRVSNKQGTGICTKEGKYIIPPSRGYGAAVIGYKDDHWGKYFKFSTKNDAAAGICNANGEEMCLFYGLEDISPWYEKGKYYYMISKNKLYGIMDCDGHIVVEPIYKGFVVSDDKNYPGKFVEQIEDENGKFKTVRIVGSLSSIKTTRNPLLGKPLPPMTPLSSSNNNQLSNNNSKSSPERTRSGSSSMSSSGGSYSGGTSNGLHPIYQSMQSELFSNMWKDGVPATTNSVPSNSGGITTSSSGVSNGGSSSSTRKATTSQHDLCNGTGKCKTCNGSGQMWVGTNKKQCVNCGGSGRCRGCNGTGKGSSHYY